MVRKTLVCLVVVVAAVVLVTAFAGPETPSAAPDGFRLDAAKLKDKALWTQVNTEPYYISSAVNSLCRAAMPSDYVVERKTNPHAGTYITVYVNGVGRKAMFAKKLQRFPEGSVIVKEKIGTLSEGPEPLLYTIMVKRESGYNPAVGDWEFSVVAGNGTQLEARGKLENCQACHIAKKDSDFIFGSYRQLN